MKATLSKWFPMEYYGNADSGGVRGKSSWSRYGVTVELILLQDISIMFSTHLCTTSGRECPSSRKYLRNVFVVQLHVPVVLLHQNTHRQLCTSAFDLHDCNKKLYGM
jgi:hypothetical protein